MSVVELPTEVEAGTRAASERRRFSVEEYHRMIDAGVFDEDERWN